VSNPFHPITNEAAFTVASNLSEADRRECAEGYGLHNALDIALPAINSNSYYFKTPDGKSAAMGGVDTDGRIWMLCTPLIKEYPLTFARDCRRMIDSRKEKLLWNIVDKRNITHLKLLRFLGFKFLREVIHGPNNLIFIEFCKIQCA
tara:strand:+ start:263 stop:703 length:441 start_codon:yes stop_codon:yes gene_type:complete